MMQYINLNQAQLIKYNINLNEGLILDYVIRANSWAETKKDKEGKTYFRVSTGKMLKDLPIIGDTKKGFLDKIKKLVDKGFLKRYSARSPYYRPTEITKNYLGHQMVTKLTPNGVIKENIINFDTKWGDNSNSYNNNSYNYNKLKYIFIPISLIKEKNKGLIEKLEDILSSLKGENNFKTDLAQVSTEEIVKLRNSIETLPKVNLKNKNTGTYRDIQYIWGQIKKKYTKEELNKGLNNYLKDIKSRKYDPRPNSYYNHRFSFYLFFKQKNGFTKFLSL